MAVTAKRVTAKCQFIFSFTTPSSDHDRLTEFVKVSLSSACGIPQSVIDIDRAESRLDMAKTFLTFSLTGNSEIDVWTMVTRIRKAVADKTSPLNTIGMMKRVFNGAVFEGFEPSSQKQESKGPKYHVKAAVDMRSHARLPTPVVESQLLTAGSEDGSEVAGTREVTSSPKVVLSLPKGSLKVIPQHATEASWEARSPKRGARSRGNSMSSPGISPSSKFSVPSSAHIPFNASHYPFDVVVIPAGVKSARESPKREVHLHLPPPSLSEEPVLKYPDFIDLKRVDELYASGVPVVPASLLRTIDELTHALTS